MATGALGYMAISPQNSFGTAQASFSGVPFVSETLVHRLDKLPVQGIRATLIEAGAVPGIERSEGDVVVEPDPCGIGWFLRGIFGEPVSTLTNTDAGQYTHVFNMKFTDWTQKCCVPASTLWVWRGTQDGFQFTDLVFPRMTLTIDANALVRATFSAIGRTVSLTNQASVISNSMFQGATDKPFAWNVASVSIAGTAPEVYESLTWTVDGMVEGVVVLDATRKYNKFGRRDRPTIRANGRIDLENLDEYDRFAAQSTNRLFVNLRPMVGTSGNGQMLIDIPSFEYDSVDAQVGGPGRVSVDWTGRALYNTGSATAMTITLINTQTHYCSSFA